MPTYEASITDGVGSSDAYIVLDTILTEAMSSNGAIASQIIWNAISAEAMSSDDTPAIQIVWNSGVLTEGATVDDAIAPQTIWDVILAEAMSIADTKEVHNIMHPVLSDAFFQWDTPKWGWQKSISDSMDITETISKILGIPVKDYLTLTDTETNNWDGVEAVSDGLFVIDISRTVQIYDDLVADGMDVADAVKVALQLIITDILTCTDTVLNIGQFQHSVSDSMTLADVVRRLFPKSVSDSFSVTDTSLIDFLALLQITDSLDITEATIPGLTIPQTIADTLEALDTITLQQFLQELIQDGLNISVIVELDDEIWECWVLNTGAFHPSVYSGYDYNSFAIFNNTVYGCKSDGIYELSGDTDDGTAFHSGIILPETQFNSANNKRFRKAWLGVSGDNVLLKAETESGWHTFCVNDAEVSLSRDLKGRSWKFSVENFDSLDMIELVQILLSKK